MKKFIVLTISNCLLAFCFAVSMSDNYEYEQMSATAMGAVLFAALVDLPLILTLPIAFFASNVPAAIFMMAISNLLFRIFLIKMIGHGSYIELAVLSQVFIGLLFQRSISYWRKRETIPEIPRTNFLYRRFSVQPMDWGWRKRTRNLLKYLTKKWDFISLSLVLLTIAISVLVRSLDGLAFATFGYVVCWVFYLGFIVLPLILAEEGARMAFSLSRSDYPKKTLDQAVNGLKTISDKVKEKDLTNRTSDWIRKGFSDTRE